MSAGRPAPCPPPGPSPWQKAQLDRAAAGGREDMATCRLCQPDEEMPTREILDHLRVMHPGRGGSSDPPVTDVTAPFQRPVMRAADLEPHGACCTDCGREFAEGDPYAERPLEFIGDIPAVEIVCLACAGEAS